MGWDLNQAMNNVVGPVASVFAPPLAQYIGQGQTNQQNWDATQAANQASQASADRQMAFQADQVKKQQEYETEMSNTAHQREAKDLAAAGLNPILAANAGASTPSSSAASGAMADQKAAPYTSPIQPAASSTIATAQAVASLVSTLNQASLVGAQRDNIRAQTANYQSSAAKTNLDADILRPQADLYKHIDSGIVQPVIEWLSQRSQDSAPKGRPTDSWRQKQYDRMSPYDQQHPTYFNLPKGGLR